MVCGTCIAYPKRNAKVMFMNNLINSLLLEWPAQKPAQRFLRYSAVPISDTIYNF